MNKDTHWKRFYVYKELNAVQKQRLQCSVLKEAWMLLIRGSAYGWPDLVRGATISNPEGSGEPC